MTAGRSLDIRDNFGVTTVSPAAERRAGIVLVDLALQAGASLEEVQDALEAIGILDYTPGVVRRVRR